ncbi:MAG: T9SS type A sorting domain-containing protein, partial [Chitinophagaceae bacterium]|nr:T9SS type A sorting domain-containing protein [Chitinophagaceae bacterium]
AILSHTKSGEKAIVRIVDITGKTLIAQNVQSNATQSSIDVSKLVKGTYIVVFENEGATSAARLIKQ